MQQTPNPPTHLFFYCEIAAASGGEVIVQELLSYTLMTDLYLRHQY
jgi:hypothetical protein